MNYAQPQNLFLRDLPAEVSQAIIDASEFVQIEAFREAAAHV